MATITFFGKTVVILCMVWALLLPLFIGGSWGREFFSSWAKALFPEDAKAGVPVLMLTFPILIAGCVASLCTVTTTGSTTWQPSRCFSCLANQWFLLVILVLFPCCVYLFSSLHRHLQKTDLMTDYKLAVIGNSFGMLATLALAWLLIPATQSRGPITILFGWDPIKVVQIFHAWSGWIVVMGSVVHGILHCLRLRLQSNTILMSYLFPPLGCWRHPQSYNPLVCELGGKGDCTCYEQFRVSTGLVGMIGLLLIGVSSLYKIRRKYFSSFIILHYILTPLTFLIICIHYNRAIIYASGSLLYYLASCCPIWVECLGKRMRRQATKLVLIENIDADPTQSHRMCVALTFEASKAAMEQYRPGVYSHLLVPSISQVAHPFTIIQVPKQPQQIRIIFRVSGHFTNALQRALCENLEADHSSRVGVSNLDALPDMYLSGLSGRGILFEQLLRHDICIIVAAGVGITPYLSLFSALSKRYSHSGTLDGLVRERDSKSMPAKIIFHWICRDDALIKYCRNGYMDIAGIKNAISNSGAASIHINIYHTGVGYETFSTGDSDGESKEQQTSEIQCRDTSSNPGCSFDVSRYRTGSCLRKNLSFAFLFAVLAWGGLVILWRWYLRQESGAFVGRLATVLVVTFYGLAIAALTNVFWYFCVKQGNEGWSRVSTHDDREADGLEMPTYEDTNEEVTSHAALNKVDYQCQEFMQVKIHQGRPSSTAEMLNGLHDGIRPALFCCAPSALTKSLTNNVRRSLISCSAHDDVAIYQESFEI
jgi:predicted ferric reductase